MQCPICLEALDQALVFSCGHSCCSPCYTAAEITTCPYCSQDITTTTPAPWLNCRSLSSSPDSSSKSSSSSDSDSTSKSSSSSDSSNSSDSLETSVLKTNRIVDIRGYELDKSAALLRERITPVVSKIGIILKARDDGVKSINDRYQSELNRITMERDQAWAQLAQNTQVQLDQDETNVKSQEYNNQDLEHLALTCMALSTQTSQVLDQALPIHQPRIRKLLFEWPFGITPDHPEGVLPVHPESRFPNDFCQYIYLDGPNICVQVVGKTMSYTNDKNVRKTVTFTSRPKVKCYDDKIYAYVDPDVLVYNSRLEHIDTINSQIGRYDEVKDFYMDQGKIQFVYSLLATRHTYGTLAGKPIEIRTMDVTDIEVVGNIFCLRDWNKVMLFQNLNKTFIDPQNYEIRKFENSRFFISNGKVYVYSGSSEGTFVKLFGTKLVYKGPPGADYVPWAKNTVLMINEQKATLLTLD